MSWLIGRNAAMLRTRRAPRAKVLAKLRKLRLTRRSRKPRRPDPDRRGDAGRILLRAAPAEFPLCRIGRKRRRAAARTDHHRESNQTSAFFVAPACGTGAASASALTIRKQERACPFARRFRCIPRRPQSGARRCSESPIYASKMSLSCADACMAGDQDKTQCIRLCLDASDVCEATARLGARAHRRRSADPPRTARPVRPDANNVPPNAKSTPTSIAIMRPGMPRMRRRLPQGGG